jgi:hemerythrin-like domain-containing protein
MSSVSSDIHGEPFRGESIVSNEQYADVSEMYMAHAMFRREFGLLPALIGGVSAADAARAHVIAQHFELIQTVLHHHHHAEDVYLWPRILNRAGQDAGPVMAAMEKQHEELDEVLTGLAAGLRSWQETVDQTQGAALAETAVRLAQLLSEHLTAEEERALPLIARYVTAAEWGEMAAESAADIAPEQLPLLFGLMTYEGDPEVVKAAIGQMPAEVRPVMAGLAAEAFARHAELVHGTSSPVKGSEL